MRASNVNDLSTIVRSRRKELGLTQAQLAEKAGVQTLWVSQFERGKTTAQVGIVMRVLRVLNLTMSIDVAVPIEQTGVVNLNSLLK